MEQVEKHNLDACATCHGLCLVIVTVASDGHIPQAVYDGLTVADLLLAAEVELHIEGLLFVKDPYLPLARALTFSARQRKGCTECIENTFQMFPIEKRRVGSERPCRWDRQSRYPGLIEARAQGASGGRVLKVELVTGGIWQLTFNPIRASRCTVPGDSTEECGKFNFTIRNVFISSRAGLVAELSHLKAVAGDLIRGARLVGARFSGGCCYAG